jgi:hypothetical protein
MKIIDTSPANTNNWLPLLGNYYDAVHSTYNSFVVNGSTSSYLAGIDFIQQAYTECINAIAEFAIADTTKVTILYGCNIFYVPPYISHEYYEEYSDVYGIAPGWIYYQGELYYVQGLTFGTHTDTSVNATITTSYSAADPAVFSNSGGTHNVHMIRNIVLTTSDTAHSTGDGSIIPDWGYWLGASSNSNAQTPVTNTINNWVTNTWTAFTTNYDALVTPAITRVGTDDNPQFETGWSSSGLTSTLNMLSYYKVFNRVYLWGEITHANNVTSSVIFHLPPEYHPLSTEEVFAVPDIGAANYSGGGHYNVANTYYIWIQSDGSVTFLGNSTGDGSCKISLSGINFLAGVFREPIAITS